MAKKGPLSDAVTFFKNADKILHIFTNRGLFDIGKIFLDLYGEEVKKRVQQAAEELAGKEEAELGVDNPYAVLGASPIDYDIVIRHKFRVMAKTYHPDVGTHPDEKEFQRGVEAYNAIMEARKIAREARRN